MAVSGQSEASLADTVVERGGLGRNTKLKHISIDWGWREGLGVILHDHSREVGPDKDECLVSVAAAVCGRRGESEAGSESPTLWRRH